MGLASKLAASSAPGGGAPGGYGAPQQQQAPGAYPPQLQPGQQRPGAPGGQGAYVGQSSFSSPAIYMTTANGT
ncbi:MAG: hypothetical protein M1827_001438 [Pycnora praestabilis]|nr:MAG: hypothetical protein M1827_001438 [Pycnora praestabilis]